MFFMSLVIYAFLGFLLSNAGVNIVDHPFKFLSILACVVAIDILSSEGRK